MACVTFLLSSYRGEPAWQLRGMAVDQSLQSQGLGKKLLDFALQELFWDSPIRLLWCNARTSAVRFYERLGWNIDSDQFHVEHIGPHFVMVSRFASHSYEIENLP